MASDSDTDVAVRTDGGTDDSNLTEYELTGTRLSPKRMTVDTGEETFEVGHGVNPVEYFLGSIVACLNSTGTMVARDMDVDIDSLEATIEGGVDYARYMGRESENRPGLQSVEVELDVVSDADAETLDAWLGAVKERCPVTDNVENETGLSVTLDA